MDTLPLPCRATWILNEFDPRQQQEYFIAFYRQDAAGSAIEPAQAENWGKSTYQWLLKSHDSLKSTLGLPLLCYITAETLKPYFYQWLTNPTDPVPLPPQSLTLAHLYEYYFISKAQIFLCRDVGVAQLSKLNNVSTVLIKCKEYFRYLKNIAYRQLFTADRIMNNVEMDIEQLELAIIKKIDETNNHYEFIHYTVEQYFAALYFMVNLGKGTGAKYQQAVETIIQNKYHRQYEQIWQFMFEMADNGVILGFAIASQITLQTLFAESRDLFGYGEKAFHKRHADQSYQLAHQLHLPTVSAAQAPRPRQPITDDELAYIANDTGFTNYAPSRCADAVYDLAAKVQNLDDLNRFLAAVDKQFQKRRYITQEAIAKDMLRLPWYGNEDKVNGLLNRWLNAYTSSHSIKVMRALVEALCRTEAGCTLAKASRAYQNDELKAVIDNNSVRYMSAAELASVNIQTKTPEEYHQFLLNLRLNDRVPDGVKHTKIDKQRMLRIIHNKKDLANAIFLCLQNWQLLTEADIKQIFSAGERSAFWAVDAAIPMMESAGAGGLRQIMIDYLKEELNSRTNQDQLISSLMNLINRYFQEAPFTSESVAEARDREQLLLILKLHNLLMANHKRAAVYFYNFETVKMLFHHAVCLMKHTDQNTIEIAAEALLQCCRYFELPLCYSAGKLQLYIPNLDQRFDEPIDWASDKIAEFFKTFMSKYSDTNDSPLELPLSGKKHDRKGRLMSSVPFASSAASAGVNTTLGYGFV